MPTRMMLKIPSLLVVVAACFVHAGNAALAQGAGTARTTPKPPVPCATRADPSVSALPAPVAEMRDAILAAVNSGQIEELRVPLDWNEIKPEVADRFVADPIAHWKETSNDGKGREILAALGEVIDAGYAVVPLGKDIENNRLYVWPALAEAPLDRLTPEQEVQLYRLVSPGEVKAMREKKKWTWYRLVIGADGTWHSFTRSQ